jgi:outer membrane protein OmpA-like peptidoglycan-associated protein
MRNYLLGLLAFCWLVLPCFGQEYDEADINEIKRRERPFVFNYQFICASTKKPIDGLTVKIIEEESRSEAMSVTDSEGRVFIRLAANKTFTVRVTHNAFFTETFTLTTRDGESYELIETKELEPIVMGATRKIENFYFYPNDRSVPEDCLPFLERLYGLLKMNSGLRLEIATHTDSRGDDDYNLTLSQERAEAIVEYLVEKGISASRLVARGYGETRLVNHCENDIKCSSREHEQNRRVEYTIIGI